MRRLVDASWRPTSVVYRAAHGGVDARVYFCADGGLYWVPETGGAPTSLPMGVPLLTCGGAAMVLDANGRIVTPAVLEGTVGVVSIEVP